MLNELALIRNGLGDEYIQTVHKHLAEPGKNNVLRILLSSDPTNDRIDDLHCVQGEEHKNYWTQGIGNKNQFPAVKLPFPLRPSGVGAYESWKKDCKTPSPQQQLDCLEKLRNVHPIDISKHQDWPDYRQKLIERMEIYKNLQGDATIVHSLLDTFLAIENNGSAFLAELDEKLWKQCQFSARKEILNIAALILFAGGQSLIEGFILHGKRPTLLFDLSKGDLYSAAHKCWKIHISSALYTYEEREGNNKQRYGTCAISGDADVPLVADTFPTPKCKHLGNITLFSRKAKVFTYERYRKGAAHSMAVSKALADELAGALDYLNQSEKKGKTWDILPSETGKGDLLLAFCRSMPDVEPIRLLTPDADWLEETEYELEAKQICESFKGKNPDLTIEPRVDFLIIRKISDGVQKAIFSSSQTLSNLAAATDNWVQASNNLPSIELMFYEKGEKSPRFKSPRAIYPQQFAILFKKHYNRDIVAGKHPAVPGLPFSETMALFLNENCGVDLLSRLLNRLIRQFANLLEQGALKKTKRAIHHKDAHHALSAMGLLLYKLDRTKEVYMNELASN